MIAVRPVNVREGERVDLGVGNVVRMLAGGVQLPNRRVPRREVAGRLLLILRTWWAWTTALPGERFYYLTRDLYVEVRRGLPHQRQVGHVSGQMLHALGERAFELAPSEPLDPTWDEWPQRWR